MNAATPSLRPPRSLRCILAVSAVAWGIQAGAAVVDIEKTDTEIRALVDRAPVFVYHLDKVPAPAGVDPIYGASGFFHPLYSPSGLVLTDDFPVGHFHQHGLFHAWRKAVFRSSPVNFWEAQRNEGFTEHGRFLGLLERKDARGFRFERREVSRLHGPAIVETWEVWVHAQAAPYVIDIAIEEKTATGDPVEMLQFNYGGLGVRCSAQWNPDDPAHFKNPMETLTSETDDRVKANHSRPRWVAAFGPLDGKYAGVAVLDHHDNFRSPQPVRVHPTMPYFTFAPVVIGGFRLEPGQTMVSRYRVILFDGKPAPQTIETLYEDFQR